MLPENFISSVFFFSPLIFLSFIVSLLLLPKWIRKAKSLGLVWEDVHKKGSPKNVAGSGGICVLLGAISSIFLYIGIRTFIFNTNSNLIEIFALTLTVILAGIVGFVDDLFGWKKGGLSKFSRILMLFFIAIPFMVINAGTSTMLGIDFGLFYPLIFIPLAIVAVTSTFNFVAGFNGLESSQGIILLLAVSIVNLISGNFWLALIGMIFIASLISFWIFNKYPAKVFPGDIMTYGIGALIACLIILGNIEKIGIFFFIPYILELILKARGKLKIQSFGKLEEDGSLSLRQKGIYGLEHIAIRILRKIKTSKKAYEWEVPLVINLFQIIIIVLGFLIFM